MAHDVAAAYDRWATNYDDSVNPTRDLDACVVRFAPLQIRGADVVELGCGTGKNTAWLADHARSVTALDFSAGMLDIARKRVTSLAVRFVQHDIREQWPVPDRSADIVIGNLVLEHVQDMTPVYEEAARVLRPAGELFLCELHPYKQLAGSQARFVDPSTNEVVRVAAFPHTVSEYVNTGIATGLMLVRLDEWSEAGAGAGQPPRLVAVLFARGD